MMYQERIVLFIACLFINSISFAHVHRCHHGGSKHHVVYGNVNHNNYSQPYYNNVWYIEGSRGTVYRAGGHHGDWYNEGGVATINRSGNADWFDNSINNEEVIGTTASGYFDPSCMTIQTCTYEGNCITQHKCD